MIDKVGDEFAALIISTTRFGFFVELEDLFIEGLVPLDTLLGDRYTYHENVRKIIGERSRRQYSIGDHVRVRLDRVDGVEKKLQFSVVGSQAGSQGAAQNHERQRVAGDRAISNRVISKAAAEKRESGKRAPGKRTFGKRSGRKPKRRR
jgi:ribonuclease R